MSFIAPFLPAISAIIGVTGTIMQAQSAAANAKGRAAAARFNADQAAINARLAREEAAANEAAQRREAGMYLARQRASMAEGGVLESASSWGVMEQTANDAELDALNIRYHGELKAMGLLADVQRYSAQETVAQNNARQDSIGGYLNAAKKTASFMVA